MSFEYEVPEGLLYSRNHEWLRVKGKIATVGVTDYVQRKLREVLYIELPNTNVKVVRGAARGHHRIGQGQLRGEVAGVW